MDQTELLKYAADLFERLGIKYMVVGSYASIAYGEMRSTNDIDMVADLESKHIPKLIENLPSPQFYVTEESIREAIRYRSQFNIIHAESMSKVDVYVPKQDQFSKIELSDRMKVNAFGMEFFIARPEYVILKKLEYYQEGQSEKHLRDIASMLKVSGAKIDLKVIDEWAAKIGLKETWEDFFNKYQNKK
jgi:hypothetical protein